MALNQKLRQVAALQGEASSRWWDFLTFTDSLPPLRYTGVTLWSITRRRFHNHCRNVLFAHQLIEGRHIRLHNLRKLLQLSIDLPDHLVINNVRLRIRSCFGAAHDATKRRQLVVE